MNLSYILPIVGRAFGCLTFLITTAAFSYFKLPNQPLRYSLRPQTEVITYLNKYDKRLDSDFVLANRITAYLHCLFVSSTSLYLQFHDNPLLVNQVLIWSASYFLCDLFYIIAFERDFKFMLHHVACITLWSIALTYNIGKEMAIGGLLIAETTSLVWIPWETAGMFTWDEMRKYLSLPTMVAYCLLRGCGFPLYLLSCLVKIYAIGLPFLTNISLMAAVILVGTGSLLWTPRVIEKCLKYGVTK